MPKLLPRAERPAVFAADDVAGQEVAVPAGKLPPSQGTCRSAGRGGRRRPVVGDHEPKLTARPGGTARGSALGRSPRILPPASISTTCFSTRRLTTARTETTAVDVLFPGLGSGSRSRWLRCWPAPCRRDGGVDGDLDAEVGADEGREVDGSELESQVTVAGSAPSPAQVRAAIGPGRVEEADEAVPGGARRW